MGACGEVCNNGGIGMDVTLTEMYWLISAALVKKLNKNRRADMLAFGVGMLVGLFAGFCIALTLR